MYLLSNTYNYNIKNCSRSKIYYGLRDVGKTVLLNKIEEIADDNLIMYGHLEVSEEHSFKEMLVTYA